MSQGRDHRFDDVIGHSDARFKGGGGFTRILLIALLVLAAGVAFTTVYSVDTDEVGVVLRFGQFVPQGAAGPPLQGALGHRARPLVRVHHVYKAEFGFRTKRAGVTTAYEAGATWTSP